MCDIKNLAFLGWRMNPNDRAGNYCVLAEGYEKAALRLLESLQKDNSKHDADAVVFPVLFCAHQSVELYLKAAYISQQAPNRKDQENVEVLRTHNLHSLIDKFNEEATYDTKIKRNANEESESLYELIDICEHIGEKANGYFPDFARYPESLQKIRQRLFRM